MNAAPLVSARQARLVVVHVFSRDRNIQRYHLRLDQLLEPFVFDHNPVRTGNRSARSFNDFSPSQFTVDVLFSCRSRFFCCFDELRSDIPRQIHRANIAIALAHHLKSRLQHLGIG
jgi:hypothetical protein